MAWPSSYTRFDLISIATAIAVMQGATGKQPDSFRHDIGPIALYIVARAAHSNVSSRRKIGRDLLLPLDRSGARGLRFTFQVDRSRENDCRYGGGARTLVHLPSCN